MRAILFIIFFSFLADSCRQADSKQGIKDNFDKEIRDRLGILTSLSACDDSLAIQISDIRKDLDQLMLLSKDVENLSACANRSNQFFKRMADLYDFSPQEVEKVDKNMSPSRIELVLKKNELFLLNQIVFTNSGADIRLFSAMEDQ